MHKVLLQISLPLAVHKTGCSGETKLVLYVPSLSWIQYTITVGVVIVVNIIIIFDIVVINITIVYIVVIHIYYHLYYCHD